MHLTVAQSLWFLPVGLPLGIWAAWSDMRSMKIPNVSVVVLGLGFLILGLFALPLDAYGVRVLQMLAVLFLGFVLNMIGAVGAGDAKFAAAMAPFIAPGDGRLLLVLFAAVLLAAFATHRLFRLSKSFRALTPGWESWARRDFPMGLALGGTLIFYLGLGLWFGA
jgi:prepilin peptidase CpaA